MTQISEKRLKKYNLKICAKLPTVSCLLKFLGLEPECKQSPPSYLTTVLALNPHPLNTIFQGQEQENLQVSSDDKVRVDKAFENMSQLQVSDLQPNTLYFVMLMALNGVGTFMPVLEFKLNRYQDRVQFCRKVVWWGQN